VPGRVLTVIAVVAIVVSTIDIVYRDTRWRALAVMGGAGILSVGFLTRSGPLARVDFLAAAFSFLGVCVTLRQLGTRRWTWPVVLFLLAGYTKQSAFAGAAASLVYLAAVDRRKAIKSAALLAGVGLAVLVVLQVASGGNFLRHVVRYTWTRCEWRLAWSYGRGALRQGGWLFALTAAGLVVTTRLRVARLVPARRGRGLIILYLAFCVPSILQLAKVGSSYLYLVELAAVGCLTLPLAIGDLCVLTCKRPRLSAAVGIMAVVGVATQVALGYREISAGLARPSALSQERLEMYLRTAEGPILAEDIGAVICAGHPAMVNPFIVSQLGAESRYEYARGDGGRKRRVVPNGTVPQIAKAHDRVLADIVAGRFALIETGALLDPTMYMGTPRQAWGMAYMITDRRFSPAWQEAIAQHYRLEHMIGIKGIYVKRDP